MLELQVHREFQDRKGTWELLENLDKRDDQECKDCVVQEESQDVTEKLESRDYPEKMAAREGLEE